MLSKFFHSTYSMNDLNQNRDKSVIMRARRVMVLCIIALNNNE